MVTPMMNKTLIIGNGKCAQTIAEQLARHDIDVIAASTGGRNVSGKLNGSCVELYDIREVRSCSGQAGGFEVSVNLEGGTCVLTAGNIIVADDYDRIPNYDIYNVSPAPNVMRLCEVAEKTMVPGGKTVFLTGTVKESNPVVMAEVMKAALMLKNWGEKVYILLNNLKVAGDGLESLFRESREAGVMYVKFTDDTPEITQKDDGITIEFNDAVTRQRFRLSPDTLIVDETLKPSKAHTHLGDTFRLHLDAEGFLQADNVHRYTVQTNRRGILVAGPSRGVMDNNAQQADAACAVSLTLECLKGTGQERNTPADIDAGNCVRCLTCYRLCSYRAIRINQEFRVAVIPDECERCGVCAAECPRGAISIENLKDPEDCDTVVASADEFTPSITAFCCARSAGYAKISAGESGEAIPEGLTTVTVPCGGGIASEFILDALKTRSDGVLVFTCHNGNCHSEHGATLANSRAEALSGVLEASGLEKGRVSVKRIAGNMARDFVEAVRAFENDLVDLGPSKLL